MKSFFLLAFSLIFILSSPSALAFFATAPAADVEKNVVILQNATPSQCEAAKNGGAPQEQVEAYSEGGEYTGVSPGVRTCSGCSVDPNTKDCICQSCYSYFN